MSMAGTGPRGGFRVPPQSYAKIRQVALNCRKLFKQNAARLNAEKLLSDIELFDVALDVIEDDDPILPNGVEACWDPDERILRLRDSVYTGACTGDDPRALFTVGHECGHIFLEHRRPLNREPKRKIEWCEDSEWQGDAFSGEFTMPLDHIQRLQLRTVPEIMKVFGTSRPAAEIRLNVIRRFNLV